MLKPILKVQALHKNFGGLKAVDGCSFTIERASITGLIGPNGAGKTTVFNLITGLSKPDSGHVYFEGKEITNFSTPSRAKMGLTRTFQAIRLFQELTVLENVAVAFKNSPNEREEALELLEQVGLKDKANFLAGDLSYGQQKLLEIARAMAVNPSMILLDEPAAGINRTALKLIAALIRHLQKQGKTLLIVEHDMNFIMELCEHIVVLDFGRVIAEGKPKDIQKNPKVLEAYLGSHVKN